MSEVYIESISGLDKRQRSQVNEDVVCTLSLQAKMLMDWKYNLNQGKASSYVSQLNENIKGKIVQIATNRSDRLESRLSKKAGEISTQLRKRTRNRETILKTQVRFTVTNDEVLNVKEIEEEYREQIVTSHIQIQELKHKQPATFNKGKSYHDVDERQKRRKMTAIKESSQNALTFIRSYELDVKSILLTSPKMQEDITINFDNQNPTTSPALESSSPSLLDSTSSPLATSSESTSPLPSLPSDQFLPVTPLSHSSPSIFAVREPTSAQILYLLDKYGVSDEFYHELSMVNKSLPRSHRVKDLRRQLSDSVPYIRLLPPYSGCYRPFESALKDALEPLFRLGVEITSPIEVKLSGDGAPFYRSTSYILLSFSLPSIDPSSSSATGTHTIGILQGAENYDTIKDGFSALIEEVNHMIDLGVIRINGSDYTTNFVIGGDYKFLLLIYGLNAAHSNYSCLFCHIKKDKRYDTSIAPQHCQTRTLSTIDKCLTSSTEKFGVAHKPLFNIETDQVIIDELHLLLRITDVLINNLVLATVTYDHNSLTRSSTIHLDMLLGQIQSCGITFRVWESTKKKNDYEFTSLRGDDRKKLLQKLPPHIVNIIPGNNGLKIAELWNDFWAIYQLIGKECPTDADISSVQVKSLRWITNFTAIPLDGHRKANVTPYMHIMAYHVPQQMKKHNGIKRFTGQGVEKNNDMARRNYFSSNHKDAPKDVILTENRIHKLSSFKREKRKYSKINDEYWKHDIFEQRQPV